MLIQTKAYKHSYSKFFFIENFIEKESKNFSLNWKVFTIFIQSDFYIFKICTLKVRGNVKAQKST